MNAKYVSYALLISWTHFEMLNYELWNYFELAPKWMEFFCIFFEISRFFRISGFFLNFAIFQIPQFLLNFGLFSWKHYVSKRKKTVSPITLSRINFFYPFKTFYKIVKTSAFSIQVEEDLASWTIIYLLKQLLRMFMKGLLIVRKQMIYLLLDTHTRMQVA